MSESEKTKSPSKGPSSDSKAAIRAKLSDPLLNPRRLHETLLKEINKEAIYDLENETKLRAVTQGTVNYEQFRYANIFLKTFILPHLVLNIFYSFR